MENLCERYGLLKNEGGIIRVPFLVKGNLVVPSEVSLHEIEEAFRAAGDGVTYVRIHEAQVIREPVINRRSMEYDGTYIYQVMRSVKGGELIEADIDKLAGELYSLTFDEILDYLDSILSVVNENIELSLRVRELCRLTSEYPDRFLDRWFTALASGFKREEAARMIDSELSAWGKPGRDFLNGWVDVSSSGNRVRAMPTRQLHITAGNVPEVPIASALRAILTKSAAVVKLPYGAVLPGALLSLAARVAAPEHPITKNLSVVYWHGGDTGVEESLFQPNAFDRIVVWGSPEALASVRSRALFTRIVGFNPRYSVSFIGKEAFTGDLASIAEKGAEDAMIFDQKACTSSLVHYVEGTEEQAGEYAVALQQALKKWDGDFPNFVSPSATGRIKRMRRGRYAGARWYTNPRGDGFSSCVVVVPGAFDILDHPMSRVVVVRPVNNLEDALKRLHPGVSVVGVYPENRRDTLAARILARGVSSVLPLGQGEAFFAGMPHDGMFVLSELVDWKTG